MAPGARLRVADRALHARPGLRAAPPACHTLIFPRHGGHRGAAVRGRAQGLLPAAGHRHHRRSHRCAAGRLVRRDGGPGASPDARRSPRTRRWRAGARSSAAAARSTTASWCSGSSRAISAMRPRTRSIDATAQEDRRGARRHGVPAGGAGPERRRPHLRAPSTSTRCRTPISRS